MTDTNTTAGAPVKTDVQTLRDAAALMRDRAQSAEPGPWVVERPGHGKAWINTLGYEHAWGMHGFVEEARHVASWHPAVALAVADWLDLEARMAELRDNSAEGHTFHALAVARAYVGVETPA